jgi:hypothetical protein
MVGLSFVPLLSIKSGAILFSSMTAILQLFAVRAPTVPYKRTEVWLMIEADDRPPAVIAQRLVATAMQVAYRRFALHCGSVAIVLWLAVVIGLSAT